MPGLIFAPSLVAGMDETAAKVALMTVVGANNFTTGLFRGIS
jgi:hypothetical protein